MTAKTKKSPVQTNEDNPVQTLDEFVAEMQKDLEGFKAHWVKQHTENPNEDWPMKMRAGDWFDQLLCHLG